MSNALRIVWDALTTYHGRSPTGELRNFRSVCTHPGADNPTGLHVWDEGGEAQMCCHTHHCDRLDIIEPLSLRLRDLYPADRQYAAKLKPARREEFTGNARTAVNVLLAVQQLKLRWRVSIDFYECPDCESPHAQLVIPAEGEAFTHCQRGCGVEAMTGGLAARVTERRRSR